MVQHWIEHRDGSETVQEAQVRSFLESLPLWENVPEEHKAGTPKRFVKMMEELATHEDFTFTTFSAKSQDLVILEKIPFYTLCAHHVIPFYGHAYIGYVPDQEIAGLSKFARLVKQTAKGFWAQEDLTDIIAGGIKEALEPKGVAVVLRAEHLCMAMRGVEAAGVITTTSSMRGVFADHNKTAKAEFMSVVMQSW